MVSDCSDSTSAEEPAGGHEHPRGKPLPWALMWVVIAALYVAGMAVIGHLWLLFWVCAGVVVVAIPVRRIIGIMGGNPARREAGDAAGPCV